jgi:hypothetical protein
MRISSRMEALLRRALAFFLPVAVLLTVLSLLIAGTVQQVYRTSANDPQLQIATDAVLRLNAGRSPARVAREPSVDLARSLATHITVFDAGGKVLASTARLGTGVPVPPAGVLQSARSHGTNTVTWQPRPGVRVAAVVMPWKGGTVLAGRSLGPTETRESALTAMVALGWAAGMVLAAAASFLASWLWGLDR